MPIYYCSVCLEYPPSRVQPRKLIVSLQNSPLMSPQGDFPKHPCCSQVSTHTALCPHRSARPWRSPLIPPPTPALHIGTTTVLPAASSQRISNTFTSLCLHCQPSALSQLYLSPDLLQPLSWSPCFTCPSPVPHGTSHRTLLPSCLVARSNFPLLLS